jgi:hypothetical protein
MSTDHVQSPDEQVLRDAVAALIRVAGRPGEVPPRLAGLVREVGALASLGADAPLDEVVPVAHRAVHAYRPVCADPGEAPAGDGSLFVAWSRLHEALHRLER